MNKVSFVIRVRNEENDIEQTLKCLKNQQLDDYQLEVILVDSGSTDRTLEVAKKYVDKIINIKQEDFTWGRALNLGIQASSGDVIGLISGHCFIDDTFSLQRGLDLVREKKISCLYGRQIGDARKDPFEVLELDSLYPDVDYLEAPQNTIPFSNACCLIDRDAWIKLPFDENLQSAEDVDWATKMIKSGEKIGYSNVFQVVHGHPLDLSYIYRKNYWKVYREQVLLKRNNGIKTWLPYLIVANIIFRPIIQSIKAGSRMKKMGLHIIAIARYKYYIALNYSRLQAKKQYILDSKNMKKGIKKYQDIAIPNFIRNIQVLAMDE